MCGSVQKMTLFHPPEDWEPALSPSSSMTRGGAARRWPNMVPSQMFWGGYARPPFLMLWCRSVPLPEQRHFSVFCLPAQHLWMSLARQVANQLLHWLSLLHVAPQLHPLQAMVPLGSVPGSSYFWCLLFCWVAPFLVWKAVRRFPMLISPCGLVHAFTSCRFPFCFKMEEVQSQQWACASLSLKQQGSFVPQHP